MFAFDDGITATIMQGNAIDYRRLVLGPEGPDTIRLMRDLNVGEGGGDATPQAWKIAREYGLVLEDGQLTHAGWRVGDSCREFLWWEDRGRQPHFWNVMPIMRAEHFEGRDVLSVGAGAGVNLFSLQDYCVSIVGIDIEPIYLGMGPPLAELAKVRMPKLQLAPAERLPFKDDSFDLVICLAALQLTEIRQSLAEMARVTRSGGRVVLGLSDLRGQLLDLARNYRSLLSPRQLAREAQIFVGGLAYPLVGRALMRPHDPVYPPFGRMVKWLRAAGFELDRELTTTMDHEVSYVATRV